MNYLSKIHTETQEPIERCTCPWFEGENPDCPIHGRGTEFSVFASEGEAEDWFYAERERQRREVAHWSDDPKYWTQDC